MTSITKPSEAKDLLAIVHFECYDEAADKVSRRWQSVKQSYLPVRIVLGMAAAAHVIIGLIGVIPAIPLSIVLMFYGASLQINPQIAHIIQMFGAYMLAVGVLGAFAVWDPLKNKSIIYGISFLLFLRVLQRIIFAGQAYSVFGISPIYYWVQTVLFFAIALALVLLRPKASESPKT